MRGPDQPLDDGGPLAHAFSVTPVSVSLLLIVLAVAGGAVLALWWTSGRDARVPRRPAYHPISEEPSGEVCFVPPDGVRPGQLGTVVDESADVVDIVATVLDLAVRGHVVIEELPRPSPYRRPDWVIRRTPESGEGDLAPYERVLLALLLGGPGDDRHIRRDNGTRSVAVSALAGRFADGLRQMQEQLYADVHAKGWFRQRPDAVRSPWTTAGGVLSLVGLVATVGLGYAGLGLVGLGVVLAGGILAWGGVVAPARTARGSALLSQLHDLRGYLELAPGSELPDTSRAELVARILPYALVFGLLDRWARIFAASGRPGDPDAGLQWYDPPQMWHRIDVPDSLDAFVTTLSGAISTSRRLRL
ncbi:DUF2207 domain-containing protein [Actinopolymorpha sp. B9G3]|uniref:DUF2207 domain-containing protein n=1 Tax=Actinopolymorpha sp. B9G3 TaxID=3158970 RepID=UPI0032D8EFF5